jgi:hypothetical protein
MASSQDLLRTLGMACSSYVRHANPVTVFHNFDLAEPDSDSLAATSWQESAATAQVRQLLSLS